MRTDTARLAGGLYLVVVLTGLFSLLYVPSQVALSGDAPAVLARIQAAEPLFRWGIAAFIVKQVAFLLLPLALYRLLRSAGPAAATVMVALVVVSVPIALVALQGRVALLGLTQAALAPPQLALAVHLAVSDYRNGMLLTQLFWGLWLLPLGWLVLCTRVVPRLLGWCLLAGGLGYAVQVLGAVVAPQAASGIMDWLTLPAAVGEIGTCLWLLVRGAPRSGGFDD